MDDEMENASSENSGQRSGDTSVDFDGEVGGYDPKKKLDYGFYFSEALTALVLGLRSEMKDMKLSLQELRAENASLKKQSSPVTPSSAENADQADMLEKNVVRGLLEEISGDVKSLQNKMAALVEDRWRSSDFPSKGSLDMVVAAQVSPRKEYPIVNIGIKTVKEEQEAIRSEIENVKKYLKAPEKGFSFGGKTIKEVSSSMPLCTGTRTTCVLSIANFLDSTLENPTHYILGGEQKNGPGPRAIMGSTSEIFLFFEEEKLRKVPQHKGCSPQSFAIRPLFFLSECSFLSSFRIGTASLRINVKAVTKQGTIALGLCFTPEDVPVDLNLYNSLTATYRDFDLVEVAEVGPIDVCAHYGKCLARARMTPGPKSVVEVEIMEGLDQGIGSSPARDLLDWKPVVDGEQTVGNMRLNQLLFGGINASTMLDKTVCTVEIINTLNVSLHDAKRYIQNCKRHNFMPSTVPPFTREVFYASDDTKVEALFSYAIESTDVRIAVALRAGTNGNALACAFTPVSVPTDEFMYSGLTDSKSWKTGRFKIFVTAADGERAVEMRNIRATVCITHTDKSLLRINVSAF